MRTRSREGNSRHLPLLPDLLARAGRLEAAVGPIEVVFGHNDLLAANFIDDGKRLWLVDWEYAGFNSPLFDLGGLASNSELSPEQAEQALGLYFGKPVDDQLRRRAAAMTAASLLRETMWSMVSEIHSTVDFDYAAYTAENLRRFEAAYATYQAMDARMSELPSSAKIVIVGGGIVGCSVAYHLGKMGLTDTLLLERGKLTCGSTWHAAGLVGQLRTSANITQLLGYSVALYDKLEQETGLATGWKRNGGLRLACNEERWTEVKRQATTATSFGLEMHLLTPKEAQDLWPLMQIDDVIGAAFLPTDGQASPSDITMSLAKGARMAGIKIAEGAKVIGVEVENGRLRAVLTDQRAHRLRQARDLCRPMVARDRAHGRRQHSTGRGAAPISYYRADRRRDVEAADAARSGPSHLLEGGGRGPGDGRLRAQSQAVGR